MQTDIYEAAIGDNQRHFEIVETFCRTPKQVGIFGEKVVAQFYVKQGYKIVKKNWTCSLGEIDLIVKKDGALTFVEIKTRRGKADIFPELAVDKKKLLKYQQLITCYLACFDEECFGNFDVVGVTILPDARVMIARTPIEDMLDVA